MKQLLFALFTPKGIAAGLFLCVTMLAVAYVYAGSSVPFAASVLKRASVTHVVELRDEGFFPREITIIAGDTVVFKNVGTSDAWPASDPHPTHEYAAGFDSAKALLPGESWSYTFREAGIFRQHDHLNPARTGTTHVLEKGYGRGAKRAALSEDCDGKCFDQLIRETVEADGIDAAYALFQDVYSVGKLPSSCHWTAHVIGTAAYELFENGEEFPISEATSYCAYGFYHGFMEELLREHHDVDYAMRFCERVGDALGRQGIENCYHGIGHGYTEDPPAPEDVGDFQAMIDPGIEICEFLFRDNFNNLNLCLTGVFTVPAGFAAQGEYGLAIDPKRPFEYCRDQPYRYLKACYGEFAPKLNAILDYDIGRLPPYVNEISDTKLKKLVTWVVPMVVMNEDILDTDHSDYIEKCRNGFTGVYREICWGGSILGLYQHGLPEKQYVSVVSFCESEAWRSDDERRFCWGEAFRQMRNMFPESMVESVCPEIPSSYQYLCLDKGGEAVAPYNDPSFDTE